MIFLPCFPWKDVQSLLRACWRAFVLLALALAAVSPVGVQAAVHRTLVPSDILVDTTWTEAGSPYQVDNLVTIHKGATLTIGPGVVVETIDINESYNFDVREGTLIAQGTADKPILFNNTNDGWSGITINNGDDESSMNTGSILEYVILDGGGYGGSGVGGNLVLSNAEATVRHCTFMNSPGDGILSDNVANGGVAHVYDSKMAQ
jgi:hypothetical protein